MGIKEIWSVAKFALKKNEDKIFIAAGIALTGSGVVFACKATRKVDDVIWTYHQKIGNINEREPKRKDDLVEFGKQQRKDRGRATLETGWDLVKLYAPSAIMLTGGIMCFIGAHHVVSERYAALSAAYTTLDNCFKDYRGNVIAKYGTDVDKEMRFGAKVKKNSDSKELTDVKKNIEDYSDYARFFDEGSIYWDPCNDYNQMFLKNVQAHMNDKLRQEGYVFLNDVYQALGIPKSKAGQVVGWIYDKENENGVSDNFIDFGIYNVNSTAARKFVNGEENVILLDFNVDGDIWSKFM